MSNFLQSPLVAILTGGLTFLGTTGFLLKRSSPVWLPAPHAAAAEDEGSQPKQPAGPSWTFFNPEVDQLIADLQKEKTALAQRATELNELDSRLKSERQELERTRQSVQQTRQDFEKQLQKVKEDEQANLKKLGRTYAIMEPAGAATIIKQMDESTAFKILYLMKEGEAAPILETLAKLSPDEAKRAARISERLRLASPTGKK